MPNSGRYTCSACHIVGFYDAGEGAIRPVDDDGDWANGSYSDCPSSLLDDDRHLWVDAQHQTWRVTR